MAGPTTRGPGVYPGDPREDFAPSFRIDSTTYRNLARLRPAYHSSSYDYNLTAQLITDGVVETVMPRRVVVATGQQGLLSTDIRDLPAALSQGSLSGFSRQQAIWPKHKREWPMDDNWVTGYTMRGPNAWIQMELHGGASKEFKIALKDARLEFDCYTRLGLCAMAENNPEGAAVYYSKGLKAAVRSDEEKKGLMYELALAYEASGRDEDAGSLFQEIYGTLPLYSAPVMSIPPPGVHSILPLALLEAMRDLDTPIDDGLAELDSELLTKRLGLSTTVASQIERYRQSVEKGTSVPLDEAVSVFRLVSRRADAELVFSDAGRRAARYAARRTSGLRRGVMRVSPRGLRRRLGIGASARCAGEVFGAAMRAVGALAEVRVAVRSPHAPGRRGWAAISTVPPSPSCSGSWVVSRGRCCTNIAAAAAMPTAPGGQPLWRPTNEHPRSV